MVSSNDRYDACFEKPSDQGVKNKTHVEAEEAKDLDESPTSVYYSNHYSLKQRPYLLQDAQDLGQQQSRQLLPPVETFERAGSPIVNDLSPTSSSSRESAYEGSCLASIRNDPTYHIPEDNRAFLSASDYPVQPHAIPTTLFDNRNTLNEACVQPNSRDVGLEPVYAGIAPIEPLASNPSVSQLRQPHLCRVLSRRFGIPPRFVTPIVAAAIESESNLSPWNSSYAGLDILSGMPFPRAGAPSPNNETPLIKNANFSRDQPGPKDPRSHNSYAPTLHDDGAKHHATWVHRSPETRDDHDAESAYVVHTDRPEDADAAYSLTSNTTTIKRDDADLEDCTIQRFHALEEEFTQGIKGVAPKREYTYWK